MLVSAARVIYDVEQSTFTCMTAKTDLTSSLSGDILLPPRSQ